MDGIFAAVATPVHEDGRLDLATFERLVGFLLAAGVDGICVGGATGEFPHTDVADRMAVVHRAAQLLPPDRSLLVGIGAAATRHVLELGTAALDLGSRALLLPMPMFFRYDQSDLAEFASHVSRALRGPCLLYDLPEFTNPLSPATVLDLLRREEFIVGIKDSSGHAENLNTFASERGDRDWTLLVGDDRQLHRGLQAGWNGGISGVAGCCPELLVALYRSFREGRASETARLQALLDEFIAELCAFPVPWGIRIALAARGIDTGPLPLPLTPARRARIERFRQWFGAWLVRAAGN